MIRKYLLKNKINLNYKDIINIIIKYTSDIKIDLSNYFKNNNIRLINIINNTYKKFSKKINKKLYPKNKRFCTIIDRRKYITHYTKMFEQSSAELKIDIEDRNSNLETIDDVMLCLYTNMYIFMKNICCV